jgi:hypothetical protein
VYDAIASKYTNDRLEKIEVKYDDIEKPTLGGKNIMESGSFMTVHTFEELKAELGKYAG